MKTIDNPSENRRARWLKNTNKMMNYFLKLFKTVGRWFSKSHRITLYYAVAEIGQGFIFVGEPWRDYTVNTWRGELDGSIVMVVARMEALGFVLPRITWEDEPVKLKLSLTYEA